MAALPQSEQGKIRPPTQMTIEVILYFGELNALKLTLKTLNNSIDKFIIIEAKKDEKGNPKPRHFFRQQRYVKPYWKKIEYFIVDDLNNIQEIDKILKSFTP